MNYGNSFDPEVQLSFGDLSVILDLKNKTMASSNSAQRKSVSEELSS